MVNKLISKKDKKTRDKAIHNLSIFLSDSQHEIAKPDMDKLWKGMFYCALLSLAALIVPDVSCKGFWMSDKPLVQQALASELAELILTISSTAASLAFIRGFWEMTVREWNGIDRLRYVFIQCIHVFIDLFVELTSIICSYAASLTQPFAFLSERDGTRMFAKNTIAFYRGDPCGE